MVALSNPESGKVINNKLWLWHDLKIFLRLGLVGTPFPLEVPLLKKKQSRKWSRSSTNKPIGVVADTCSYDDYWFKKSKYPAVSRLFFFYKGGNFFTNNAY
jgi:hypothetical protein